MRPAPAVRYPGAALLRVLAVGMVLVTQALLIVDGEDGRDPLRHWLGPGSTIGLYGVYILFALSGFLLTRSLLQCTRPGAYVRGRAWRLLPGLLLSVLLVVPVVGAALTTLSFSDYVNQVSTWSYALRTMLLLDTSDEGLPGVVFSSNAYGTIVNGSLWTIGPLVLFTLGLGLLAALRLLRWWCLAVVLGGGLWTHLHPAGILADAQYLLPFFAAGALGALLHDRLRKRRLLGVLCLAGLAAGGAFEHPTVGFAVFGSALVVLLASIRPQSSGRAESRLPVTYLLYLLGWPAQQVVHKVGGEGTSWMVVLLLGAAAAALTAALLHRVLTLRGPATSARADDQAPLRFGQLLLRTGAVGVLVLALAGGVAVARERDLGQPRVLVVGGSSIAGALELAPELGRNSRVVIVDGGGFARSDRTGGRTVTAAVRTLPELADFDRIVLQGGEADHPAPAREVCVALLHLVDYVQAAAPHARIVVVGPIPAQAVPPPSTVLVNQALRSCADYERVRYVDALDRGLVDSDPELVEKLAEAVAE